MTNKKIDYYGVETTRYDVLLDEYEFGMKVSDYDPLFAGLKGKLVPLLQQIMEAKQTNPDPKLPEDWYSQLKHKQNFAKWSLVRQDLTSKQVEWMLQLTHSPLAYGRVILGSPLALMNATHFLACML